jgi:DNA-directed RNA polymerase specialized sigma subunit
LWEWGLFILNNLELDRFEWHNLIDRWVFDEKDRYILKRKFTDNISIEKIAEELDISESQAKRRFRKAKKILFEKI